MKNSKKVVVGAVIGGMMCGSLLTYAGTQITWGGEEDVAKISQVLSSLKGEVAKRDKVIKTNKESTDSLKEEINQKQEVIKEMDKEKVTLENHINELTETIERMRQEAIAKDNEYNDSMANADEEYMARIEKLESKVKEIQFEKETLEVAINKLNEEKQALENKYKGAVSDYTDMEDELGKARQDVENLRKEAENTLSEVKGTQATEITEAQ